MTLILLLLSLVHSAYAIQLEALGGSDAVKVSRGGKLIQLKEGATLESGDVVETDANTAADVRYDDKTLVRVAKKSRYIVYTKGSGLDKIVSELLEGAARILVPEQKDKTKIRLELQTPQAAMGVRGTEFYVEAKGEKTDLYMLHGQVSFYNRAKPDGGILVDAGHKSSVMGKGDPSPATSFPISEFLKTLDDSNGAFGKLAARKHGMITAAKVVDEKPAEVKAAKVAAVPVKEATEAAPAKDTKKEEQGLLYLNAALNVNLEELSKLNEAGVDPNFVDDQDNNALHMAAIAKKHEDQDIVIRFLATHGTGINAVNTDSQTPLVLALEALKDPVQLQNVVEVLLASGADASLKDRKKQTALQIAKRRKLKKIEALLSKAK